MHDFCGSSAWCGQRALNYRALSRAAEVRKQLVGYMVKFGVPLKSCGDDTVAIRKCLCSGYFANAAGRRPDGTYVQLRGGHVSLFVCSCSDTIGVTHVHL